MPLKQGMKFERSYIFCWKDKEFLIMAYQWQPQVQFRARIKAQVALRSTLGWYKLQSETCFGRRGPPSRRRWLPWPTKLCEVGSEGANLKQIRQP
jgi:hypothetical protein